MLVLKNSSDILMPVIGKLNIIVHVCTFKPILIQTYNNGIYIVA